MSNIEKNQVLFEGDIEVETVEKPAPRKFKAGKSASSSITNLDLVIKAISFLVALGILVVFGAVSAVLIMLDKAFTLIAIGVVIVGIICAVIALLIIYGIGHIITQNNEILKRK